MFYVKPMNLGDFNIDNLRDITKQELAFDKNADYKEWKKKVTDKFLELCCFEEFLKNSCPLNFKIVEQLEKDGYTETKFTIESEKGVTIPCYILIPTTGKGKYPVAITMQGHADGCHQSVGRYNNEKEEKYVKSRGDFAIQAVRNGFVALAVEQRGMGETKPWGDGYRGGVGSLMCSYSAQIMFMLGKTLIGARCFDISRAIDALANFKECDLDKILITGNSGGGTTSYYAACYDKRIKVSAPSCAVATYKHSILNQYHCTCNYIPYAYKYFEMASVSCMLGGRDLIVIAGEKDAIFPIESVNDAYAEIQEIYKKEGVPNKCKLVVTPKDHYWCKDIVWDAIMNNETVKSWF